jgi:hypothetical protein
MARRFVVVVIIGFVPIRVHVLDVGFLGVGFLGVGFLGVGLLGGLLAQVPVGGRRIPGAALTGGLIGLLAAPVDR